MKMLATISIATVLCACSMTGGGGRASRSRPPVAHKPAYCAFDSRPILGECIAGCGTQAGDMTDPQYHAKAHACTTECSVKDALWTPRPECR
jgi:hypothetical protein